MKIHTNHVGVVVQNNDPEKRGRVKVFFPHLSHNMYEGWNNLNEPKSFENLSDDPIRNIVNEMKDILPWAECAAPVMGETGKNFFNAENLETDGEKESPVANEEDEYGNKYESSPFVNASKGGFSIPRVGTKVWCFFEAGDVSKPVYFAVAYSGDDWGSVQSNGDDPDVYENYSKGDLEQTGKENDGVYRNKFIITQKGGVIEIVNTDDNESVSITHKNGSFKIWSNDDVKELVHGKDKKLVTDDSEETIRGNKKLHVGKNIDIIIEGNANIKVGGNCKMDVDGTYDVESAGNMTFKAPEIHLNP